MLWGGLSPAACLGLAVDADRRAAAAARAGAAEARRGSPVARAVRPGALDRARAAPRPAMARRPRARAERPPQRLALLPGGRPDLLLHDVVAAHALDAAADADRLRLAVPALPDRALRRVELPRRRARDRRPERRRPPADRPRVHVRDRRPHRGPRD